MIIRESILAQALVSKVTRIQVDSQKKRKCNIDKINGGESTDSSQKFFAIATLNKILPLPFSKKKMKHV